MSEMPFARLLVFDAIAITVWAVGVSLLGSFLNPQVELADRIISDCGWAVLAAVVLFVVGRLAWKRRAGIRQRFRSLFGSKRRPSARPRS
jgi:membrane protein DedA with SNARE-associated domain